MPCRFLAAGKQQLSSVVQILMCILTSPGQVENDTFVVVVVVVVVSQALPTIALLCRAKVRSGKVTVVGDALTD